MSTASQIKRDLRGAPLRALLSVLRSTYREERLFAVLSLADRYARGGDDDEKKVYDAYLGNLACVNNRDLVDSSAHVIVGPYLEHKSREPLYREVGNRDRNREEEFLRTRYERMPRTMLRYAIEKFPEARRKAHLRGRVQ